MFLTQTIRRNPGLVEAAIRLHGEGLLPDTYLIDMDALLENARKIKQCADACDVKLYYMLKQLGRNPEIARRLAALGYEGAVTVDFEEAQSFIRAGIHIGHVGHLVQVPKSALEEILAARPDYMTVYSIEKAREADAACGRLGLRQRLLLRVLDPEDTLYSGQYGGFYLKDLPEALEALRQLQHVTVAGLTTFPCFLYDEELRKIAPTHNLQTIHAAKGMLERAGFTVEQMNMPSATCCQSLPSIAAAGGTHGEPGHGLSGTTPLHAAADQEEIPAIVYLSEVSHNLDGKAYCYGGGHYRRSHVSQALIGGLQSGRIVGVTPPTDESIDYHFGLSGECPVSESVVMAFRTQIFVTRSRVALVEGISRGEPAISGIYTAQGQPIGG
ncbi:MAG: amino-acid racemase [Clostridiales bacterium]|uniref:alanine racemase n=1 Tax=Provencibacterium massiliense TaxID=1841868 RepID=UPI0009A76AEA|nr:alanine racemase [Provencibacterium massiliense]PWM36313.1 MAG: amino-acid racemase [Clostridiales bacterium]RGB67859.1 YhfX family PLP-dependent enzyme [Harryflintia acetispora]